MASPAIKPLKVTLVGNAGCGKTSLILRFVDNTFYPDTTALADFEYKARNLGPEIPCKLVVFDTEGQEKFRKLTSGFFKDSDGIIVCYDCTDKQSWEDTGNWFKEISREFREDEAHNPWMLIGTKADLENKVVTEQEGRTVAETVYNIPFALTSSKTGDGVDDAFKRFAKSILGLDKPQESSPRHVCCHIS